MKCPKKQDLNVRPPPVLSLSWTGACVCAHTHVHTHTYKQHTLIIVYVSIYIYTKNSFLMNDSHSCGQVLPLKMSPHN